MLPTTITLEHAEHFWPLKPKAEDAMAGTAWSRSASVSTTIGFLPPSSTITRLIWRADGDRRAAISLIARPTALEPVKAMTATSGCSTSRAPTSSPRSGHEGQHAGGQTACLEGLDEAVGDGRRLLGRLEADGVAGHEGGGHHAGRDGEGKFHGAITATTPRAR